MFRRYDSGRQGGRGAGWGGGDVEETLIAPSGRMERRKEDMKEGEEKRRAGGENMVKAIRTREVEEEQNDADWMFWCL